jgi:predicted DNA-binding transcriptional regulator AlpA
MQFSYAINEIPAITGLGRTMIYEYMNSGKLKSRKIGKRRIVLKEDLENFLKNLEEA